MAEAKTARLVRRTALTDGAALLRFAAAEPFAFIGGQYVIVNTLVPVGDGKTVKRAYSVLSSDADERTFELAVRRIGEGPGSNYMLGLEVGAMLQFSGPWGRYLPMTEDAEDAEDGTLVIATDTGITVALGLLSGNAFRSRLKRVRVLWLAESEDYFMPEALVRERLPEGCGCFERVMVPVAREARMQWLAREGNAMLAAALSLRPKAAYLSGDGFLLAAFRDGLREAGEQGPAIFVESFFHHQELKAVRESAS